MLIVNWKGSIEDENNMKPYYESELTTIYNEETLKVMDYLIEKGIKVDAIITDPPYQVTGESWDKVIPFDKMWERLKKIRRYNSTNILMFSQDPFSLHLKMSNIEEYKYTLIWDKIISGQGLFKDYQPLRKYEEINVFYNLFDGDNDEYRNILKNIHKRMETKKITLGMLNKRFGRATNGGGVASSIIGLNKKNLTIIPEDYVNHFIDLELITKKEYKKMKNMKTKPYYNCFNEQGEFKNNILRFRKITDAAVHPTQKPLELLQYLIKTYTKKGETILDFTAGSLTTCVAAEQLDRRSIGIELEKKYCDIGIKRLKNLQTKLDI